MIIGRFFPDPEGTRFQGELGFPFSGALVLIEPTLKTSDGGPDCLVLTYSEAGSVYEMGAAWRRTSRDGKGLSLRQTGFAVAARAGELWLIRATGRGASAGVES